MHLVCLDNGAFRSNLNLFTALCCLNMIRSLNVLDCLIIYIRLYIYAATYLTLLLKLKDF